MSKILKEKLYGIKCIDKKWLKKHIIVEKMAVKLSFEKYGDDDENIDWDKLYNEVIDNNEWYIPYIQIWELTTSLYTEYLVNDINKIEYGLPKRDYKDIDIPFKYEFVEVEDNE